MFTHLVFLAQYSTVLTLNSFLQILEVRPYHYSYVILDLIKLSELEIQLLNSLLQLISEEELNKILGKF